MIRHRYLRRIVVRQNSGGRNHTATCNWPVCERVIRLLFAGALDVTKIIGGICPLSDWHTAFEEMHSGRIVKAVLKPR